MENKVTSYELSKQLHELEFDCENHTGWWGIQIANTDESPTGSVQWFHHLCTETWEICKSPTKAYDCDDLLGWLAYHQEMAACWEWKLIYRPYSITPADGHGVGFVGTVGSLKFGYTCQAEQPVNALAQIIIRILKEVNNGN